MCSSDLGERPGDIVEFSNIQIEVVVPPAVSERLMAQLERELFPQFAMIAYESEVRVIRNWKF